VNEVEKPHRRALTYAKFLNKLQLIAKEKESNKKEEATRVVVERQALQEKKHEK